MSLERVIKALVDLDLTRFEAEVYVYLAKKGPKKGVNLARLLNYKEGKISSSLKILTNKGLVKKKDTMYSALPFEVALTLLIETKKAQAQVMNNKKEKLLANWKDNDV